MGLAAAASPFACIDNDDVSANAIPLKPGGKHIKVGTEEQSSSIAVLGQEWGTLACAALGERADILHACPPCQQATCFPPAGAAMGTSPAVRVNAAAETPGTLKACSIIGTT